MRVTYGGGEKVRKVTVITSRWMRGNKDRKCGIGVHEEMEYIHVGR